MSQAAIFNSVTNYLLWRDYVSKLTLEEAEKYVLIDCHNFESSLFINSDQNPAEKNLFFKGLHRQSGIEEHFCFRFDSQLLIGSIYQHFC